MFCRKEAQDFAKDIVAFCFFPVTDSEKMDFRIWEWSDNSATHAAVTPRQTDEHLLRL